MKREDRIKRMEELLAKTETEKRIFSPEEQKEWDEHVAACETPEGALRSLGKAMTFGAGKHQYSLQRLMRAACGDRTVDAGYELEVHQELLLGRKGRETEGLLVPLSAFVTKAQDGTSTSPNTGQALVGEDRREALFLNVDEFFRPPIAGALGVTMTQTDEDKLIVPVQKKRLTTGWVSRDGTAATSQDAEFASVSLQPTTLSLQFEMKRSLMYATHPQAEAILINDARQAIEAGLDQGILAGTGASNQPLGFLGTGGATVAASISGAMSGSNAYDHSRKLRDELEQYLKNPDAATKWLLHSMHVAILKKTPAFSGAQFPLIENGSNVFADKPYFESYGLPTPAGGPPKTTKGLYGDFSECVACVFGPAAELVLNPWADSVFAKGGVLARALIDFNTMHRDIKRVLRFDTETL